MFGHNSDGKTYINLLKGKEDFPEINTIPFCSNASKYVGESPRVAENRGRKPAVWGSPEML